MGNDKIVIDLSNSLNARSFEGTDIIHKSEFDRVIKIIDTKIEDNEKIGSKIRGRYNDTITILGSRGSGKTSFLMSILNYCKKERNNDIEIIELIDPTLIEEKGHIFLTLISLITDKVEKKISKNECDPCCKEYRQRKSWDDKLKKLAAGLPSIDIDNGSLYSNWHDPEHVMRKGLEAVKAAKDLEENFNKIVEEALDNLGKKAFLITFDDIDVNFNNGWKVLETIRKYLTSPRIITLLSGDLKLFSKAIRKYQWNNFGNELLTWEGEKLKRIEKYDELVTEIESQYMQKIMKAPNRIHLLTIGEKLNDGSDIYIGPDSNNVITIYQHYADFLRILGLQNKFDIHTINTYLLGLPLRTQIQILKQCKEIEDGNLSISNITDAFVSDLYESGVDVELLKTQPKDFCNIVHNFLLQKELLNENYQLLPTSESVNYNAVLFSLFTMFIVHAKNNPSMLFEYWVAIATIKNLHTILPYRSDQEKDYSFVPTIEGLSEYSYIGQNKVYRDICSHLSTYIRATLNYNRPENKLPWGGTLVLKGFASKAKGSSEEMEHRIDWIFKDKSSIKKQLAYFPLSICSFAHKQQSLVIYSLYTLLGTIVELLKRYNVIKIASNNKNTQNIIDDISISLNELSQIKDIVMPVFKMGSGGNSSDDEIGDDSLEDFNQDNKDLASAIYVWLKKCPKNVPPHLIGRIATRSFYAIRRLDDIRIEEESHTLGNAMHRRIIIVMNSAILEDAKEYLPTCDLSNNNPTIKNKIFIDNLEKIYMLIYKKNKDVKLLKLSQWLLACPLFLLYLDFKSLQNESSERIKKLIENNLIKNKEEEVSYLSFFLDLYKNNENQIKKGKGTQKDLANNTLFTIKWFEENSIYDQLKDVEMFTK